MMIVAIRLQTSCEYSLDMTKLLFSPITARGLKHNEKKDTSRYRYPHISGHS